MMFVIDFPEHLGDCPFISYCSQFKKKLALWSGTCYFPSILPGTYYCTAPHVLFTQIAWLYHVSLRSFFLPTVIALLSNSLLMISFFSCLSTSCSLSNDTIGNIQKAYLERKKISKKKNIFYYSRFFSHFKIWYSIYLGDFFKFSKVNVNQATVWGSEKSIYLSMPQSYPL